MSFNYSIQHYTGFLCPAWVLTFNGRVFYGTDKDRLRRQAHALIKRAVRS